MPHITPPSLDPAAASGAYVPADVIAHAATGTVSTDRAMLIQAIGDTPVGGRLHLPGGGAGGAFYAIDQALAIAKNITITTGGITPTFGTSGAGNSSTLPVTPFLAGTVIKQTAAATNILDLTGSGKSVNLENLGLLFASGLASTGHGINARPSTVFGGGHDYGLTGFEWDNVYVSGHDGDHYAFDILNPQYGTLTHCHSFFGGGFRIEADAGPVEFGNLVLVHPYVGLSNAGSADAYRLKAGAAANLPGSLNLCTFIRPQCFISGAAATAGTQATWNETSGASIPSKIVTVGADLETAGTNPFTPSKGTQWLVPTQMNKRSLTNTVLGEETLPVANGHINNTVFGYRAAQSASSTASVTAVGATALQNNTSGTNNTAVGQNALVANTTANENTAVGAFAAYTSQTTSQIVAVGFEALKNSTGAANTAVGHRALVTNTTGQNQTAIGVNALHDAAAGSNNNTAVGMNSLYAITAGYSNVGVGYLAGYTENSANATTTAGGQVLLGYGSGQPSATQSPMVVAIGFKALAGGSTTGYGIAIGANTSVTAAGAVAIGTDNAGTGAASTVANTMVLGTALHKHRLPGLPSQAFVASDKYVVADSNGNLHLSALGPAS